jgi:hypothetical protein
MNPNMNNNLLETIINNTNYRVKTEPVEEGINGNYMDDHTFSPHRGKNNNNDWQT